MITVKNEPLRLAVAEQSDKPTRVAFKAGSSPGVLSKILNQETDFNLASANKLADYLGLDVVVEFIPRNSPEKLPAS